MNRIEKLKTTGIDERQKFKIIKDVEATTLEEVTTIEDQQEIIDNLTEKLAKHNQILKELKKL